MKWRHVSAGEQIAQDRLDCVGHAVVRVDVRVQTVGGS
jgi:hypothetical protein